MKILIDKFVKKKSITNKDLLGIIVCQLEAMMTKEQLEKYKVIRKEMNELKVIK